MRHFHLHSKKIFILSLLMLFSISFYGQDTKTEFTPYWYLQANGVTGFSQSDISVENFSQNLGFGGNLAVGYEAAPFLGINIKAGFGSLKGERFDYTMHPAFDHDDLSFRADYIEFSFNVTTNLSNLINGYKERAFSFNGVFGIGRIQYRSTLFTGGDELYTFGFKDSSSGRQGNGFGRRRVAMLISLGLGVSLKASEAVNFNLNLMTHYTGSDQLDGLALGETKDAYTNLELGITYKFGKSNSPK